MKKIQIFSVFCIIAAVLSLSSCSYDKASDSPYALYLRTSDNFDADVVKNVFGKKLEGSAGSMSPENSGKLSAAIRDIRINNSHIALPLMLCDLPEGFSAEYGEQIPLDDDDFGFFEGSLVYGGDRLADIYIVKEKRAADTRGVIVGALLTSAGCKWSLGGADICDGDRLRDIFGEPSSSESVVSEGIPDYAYIADNGDFALFISSVNTAFVFSLDCKSLENNKELCEYVPYDDFEGFSDLAPISGEAGEFDGTAALGETGIVIGDYSCPANIRVSDMGGDTALAYYGTEAYDESDESMADYVSDTYILLYKGRNFGIVQSFRTKEQSMEEGQMYLWSVYGRDELLCDASLAGIPVSQDTDGIEAAFENCGREDNGDISMYDICEADGRKYFTVFIRNSEGRTSLIVQPYFD